MFGFSLPKLLVIVAVIAVVWYAFKFIGRRDQLGAAKKAPRQGANRGANRAANRAASKKTRDEIEDLVQCTACGTYVQSRGATCARPNCPHQG